MADPGHDHQLDPRVRLDEWPQDVDGAEFVVVALHDQGGASHRRQRRRIGWAVRPEGAMG